MRVLLSNFNPALSLLVKRSLSRFNYEWVTVDSGLDAFQKSITGKFDLIIIDFDLPRMDASEMLNRFRSLENFEAPPVIVMTLSEEQRQIIEKGHFSKTEILPRPVSVRVLVSMVQRMVSVENRIVCLGGGTGLFTLLSGLKTLSGIQLCSIVSMSDDGGSTGILRDVFGILPPGDVRRSLVALSTAPDLLNHLMQYRFEKGKGLQGHNVGNLLLTALVQMRGSMTSAVKSLAEILNIQGQVIPVTESINTLKAELENGSVIEGEHRIDMFEGHDPKIRIKKIWQEPDTTANPDVLEALHNASTIILGPGDLFTSVISNLIVNGVSEAVCNSRAKKIYICNVMTKPGETTNFQVSDHVAEIVRYLGKDVLDTIFCSNTKFHESAIKVYAKKNQSPVVEKAKDKLKKLTRAEFIWGDFASEKELVRHDSLKLAAAIQKIIQ